MSINNPTLKSFLITGEAPKHFEDNLFPRTLSHQWSEDRREDALDYYETLILKSLKGNYDDIEDFINIQQALIKVQIRVTNNITQLLKGR